MNLSEIRATLASLNTRPIHRLGQNFLHDQNLARLIAEEILPTPSDTIVEIGPGLGALTTHLAGRVRHLILIEKDPRLSQWLREHFANNSVEVITADALDFDLRRLWGCDSVKIIGNLPYCVSTPLISHFTSDFTPANRLVFTLQAEVARRLAATPNTAEFGAMSICTQRDWLVNLGRKLPPSVFYPQPKVDSQLVILQKRPPLQTTPLDNTLFRQLVRKGFSKRRKQLRNLLPKLGPIWPSICKELNVPSDVRAESLSLPQWETLARIASPSTPQHLGELFDEVDAHDCVIAPKPRSEIHKKNLRHRAVHIELFNDKGELFLQRRSPWKDLNPGLWDSSAAGHVDAGETYLQAAHREVLEELGASTTLEKIGKLPSTPETSWEFVEIYRGHHNGPFHLAGLEVQTGAFFPLEKINHWLHTRPQDFSPLFRIIFPGFIFESCVAAPPRYE